MRAARKEHAPDLQNPQRLGNFRQSLEGKSSAVWLQAFADTSSDVQQHDVDLGADFGL